MDMKRILQAMDGVTNKPVQGADSMAKFLSIVDKNTNVQVLQEGKDPHKVTLPVQMAMQHYQQVESPKTTNETSLLKKYFHEVESEVTEQAQAKRQMVNQYASVIAERVMKKRFKETTLSEGVAEGDVDEMAIAHNPDDANNPMIHGHEKANSMHLKDRIAQARAQLKELAQLADSNELIVWEKITRLSKGGMFMGLEQNLEQIRHGISELVQARKTGKQFPPKARGAIDKNIG